MTTTAHEDQFTVGTQTIERIREPYNTVSILKQNVAALEVALRTQTERAEAAEAELARLREQRPIWSGWSVWFKGGDGLFPAHFLHDSYGIPLRYPTRFAAAEKIKRHTRDSRELYEPREYSLYDAPQAPAVPEFCAVEAQLTLAEIIRNARRYLALRENEVIIMQAADPDFDAEGYRARYDAAADRLLENKA